MNRNGTHSKRSPARLILAEKPDPQEHHGWTPKARVLCCGNFEEGAAGEIGRTGLKYQGSWCSGRNKEAM
eukprot:12930370-Prorocentrum_lima.AAC.1